MSDNENKDVVDPSTIEEAEEVLETAIKSVDEADNPFQASEDDDGLADAVFAEFFADYGHRKQSLLDLVHEAKKTATGMSQTVLANVNRALKDRKLPDVMSLRESATDGIKAMKEDIQNETNEILRELGRELIAASDEGGEWPVLFGGLDCSVVSAKGHVVSTNAPIIVKENAEGKSRIKVGDAVYPEGAVGMILHELQVAGELELEELEVRFVGESQEAFAVSAKGSWDCFSLLGYIGEDPNRVFNRGMAGLLASCNALHAKVSAIEAGALAGTMAQEIQIESGTILARKADKDEGGWWEKNFAFREGEIKCVSAGFDSDGSMVGEIEEEVMDIFLFASRLVELKRRKWKMRIGENGVYRYETGAFGDCRVIVAITPEGTEGFDTVRGLVSAIRDAAMKIVNEVGVVQHAERLEEARDQAKDVLKAVKRTNYGLRGISGFIDSVPDSEEGWENLGKKKQEKPDASEENDESRNHPKAPRLAIGSKPTLSSTRENLTALIRARQLAERQHKQ